MQQGRTGEEEAHVVRVEQQLCVCWACGGCILSLSLLGLRKNSELRAA